MMTNNVYIWNSEQLRPEDTHGVYSCQITVGLPCKSVKVTVMFGNVSFHDVSSHKPAIQKQHVSAYAMVLILDLSLMGCSQPVSPCKTVCLALLGC